MGLLIPVLQSHHIIGHAPRRQLRVEPVTPRARLLGSIDLLGLTLLLADIAKKRSREQKRYVAISVNIVAGIDGEVLFLLYHWLPA